MRRWGQVRRARNFIFAFSLKKMACGNAMSADSGSGQCVIPTQGATKGDPMGPSRLPPPGMIRRLHERLHNPAEVISLALVEVEILPSGGCVDPGHGPQCRDSGGRQAGWQPANMVGAPGGAPPARFSGKYLWLVFNGLGRIMPRICLGPQDSQ